MQKIYTFTLKGFEVDLLYRNGKLAYSFQKDGSTYGIKVELKSKSIMDIAGATFQLITNAIETIEKLNENK